MNPIKVKDSTWIFLALMLLIVSKVCAQESDQRPVYLDKSYSIEDRATDLVSRMTLDEKIGLIVGDGRFIPKKTIETAETVEVPVANINSKMLIPRLSLTTLALTDGPSGINRDAHGGEAKGKIYTTAFPTGTALAATWNLDLVEKVGDAFGNELVEYDYDLLLGPGLNLHRNPKCGRNFEYYSEDPLLSGKMAASIVNGIQSRGAGATLKHFLANNQESNRRKYNAVISQRALREIYLRGFEIAVKESKPKAIMTAYNKLNGFYTPEIPELLQDITRKEWGFDGLFMTDFDMHYGDAVAQVRAGISMIMSGSKSEYDEVRKAVENKILDESTLDKNLVYNMKLRLNSARAKGYVPSQKPNLEAHAKTARKAAGEGMVLLKNSKQALPLKNIKRVALFGKISYHLIGVGHGSGEVRSRKYEISINQGLKAAGINVLREMEESYLAFIEKTKRENLVPPYFDTPKHRKDNGVVGNQAPLHFKNRLVAYSKEQRISMDNIKKYESESDAAIITLGRSAGENYENGYLPITEIERDLVRDVCEVFHASGKKVVVVLNVGGVWETASWSALPDAILLAWHPGQEGGHAVADILTGAINPSGKLPDSFPVNYEDIPSAASFPGKPNEEPVNSFYREGIFVGYRYYDSFQVPTAFEFGFGLSYTRFSYSGLKLSSTEFKSRMKVTMTVTNEGETAGKEIVQLYLSAPSAEIEKPVQELKDFAKTRLLQPGESQILTFNLDERSLASFYSGISAWVANRGKYEVRLAASSKDIRLRASFTVPEEIVVEKVHDVLYPNFMMKELSRFNN